MKNNKTYIVYDIDHVWFNKATEQEVEEHKIYMYSTDEKTAIEFSQKHNLKLRDLDCNIFPTENNKTLITNYGQQLINS